MFNPMLDGIVKALEPASAELNARLDRLAEGIDLSNHLLAKLVDQQAPKPTVAKKAGPR